MGKARRFLLLLLAVVFVFLLFRIEDQTRESAPMPSSDSGGQSRISQDEDGLRPRSPHGNGKRKPRGVPPNRTSKRSGEWTDAPTRLEVVVVDESTQTPLPEASVQVTHVWTRSKKLSGHTGPDGRAYFELDRGQYQIWANHPGYVPDDVGFAAEGSESRCTIVLTPRDPPGSLVTGSVRDRAGRGVPGVLVSMRIPFEMRRWISHPSPSKGSPPIPVRNRHPRRMGMPGHAKTDQTGAFSLEMRDGTYELHVFSLAHHRYEDEVQVPTPGPLEIVVTELDELVRLSGWVTDGEGLPLAGAHLDLRVSTKSESLGYAGAATDSGGFFEFVLPPGVATLEVNIKGHKTYWQSHEVTQDTEVFPVLRKYEEKHKTYRSFTVRVYDSKGQIVEDPFVIGTALESGKGVVSPVAGNFGRSNPPQTYHASEYPFRIYATALHLGSGITEAKVIQSYQANIDLRVRNGGRIEGNVADSDGNAVRDFTIVLRKDGFDLGIFRSFSQEGRFSLEGIPPGLYSLSFHSRRELDPTELATVRPKLVMIQNDRTSFLDVVLRPQGWVRTAGQSSGRFDSDPELRTEN